MKYVMLNSTVVCVNDIRDVSLHLGDIYINFKNGPRETLKIVYWDCEERKKDFLELCKALQELSDGGTTNG